MTNVFFVQRDGKMFSRLVFPGTVIKVADLENATPEKPSHWVLHALKKSQMYDLMQHLGITSEGNPGSKERCIKKIKAKWPLPDNQLEISDEQNSEHDNEIQDGSEVEGISDYVDRAFADNQDSSSEDDSKGRINFWNIMNYMPIFGGKTNVEMQEFRGEYGNKFASKIQKVCRGWLVRRVVRKLKVEGKLVSSGSFHDYHHMRYVAFGQTGGGKRARVVETAEHLNVHAEDPEIIKDLITSFSTPWGKADWSKMALAPQVPSEVLDAMISVPGGSTVEQRVQRLLMCLPQFKQLED